MSSNLEKREKVISAIKYLSSRNSNHPQPSKKPGLEGWISTRDVSALSGLSIYTTRYLLLKLSESDKVVKTFNGKFLYWRYNCSGKR